MDVFEELSISVEEAKKIRKGTNDFEDFCYQVYSLLEDDYGNVNQIKLEEVASQLGIPSNLIINAAIRYKDASRYDYKNPFRSRLKKDRYMKANYDKHNGEMIQKLLKVKTLQELISIFEEYGLNRRMMAAIGGYLTNMYPRSYSKKMARIQQLFDNYDQYQNEIKKKKKDIEDDIEYQKIRKEALLIADKILSRDDIYNIDGIVKTLSISKRLFIQYSKILKQEEISLRTYDKDLKTEKIITITVYDKILKKLCENRKKYYCNQYKALIDKVLEIIDKPIQIGENYRYFDLMDCVTYFNSDLPDIMEVVPIIYDYKKGESSEQDSIIKKVALLKKILNYYHFEILKTFDCQRTTPLQEDVMRKTIIKNIIDSEIVVPYTDDFDRTIVSNKRKQEIIQLMEKHKLPLSTFFFNLALKRYNDGDLELITRDNIDLYIQNRQKEK